jgi:pyruvate dehydrogenase E1 component alpha subunit
MNKSQRRRLNTGLYKKIFLVRAAENEIRAHYAEDEMKVPMHMSAGGEAIAVGVCHALQGRGAVYSTYRSHAVYLAMTGETDRFFGEMYGRTTGVARGKAGSMHLSAPAHGYLGASAIVGSNIPLAVGSAFASRELHNAKIAVAFFGDGAIDEGVFWESMNIACVMRLPVIFVCEDNALAVHIPAAERHGYKSISKIVSDFDCRVFESHSTDVEDIHELARQAVAHAEKAKMPVFLRLHYYRYLEHVGVNEDFNAGYRSRKEFEKWQNVDPVEVARRKLLSLGIKEAEIGRLEKNIVDQVEKSRKKAQSAPFPKASELMDNIFAQ